MPHARGHSRRTGATRPRTDDASISVRFTGLEYIPSMSFEKKTTVWFLGTSDFAVPSLQAILHDTAFSVGIVITQPDRPVGRKQKLTPSPVKSEAEKHGLKILQPENINECLRFRPRLGLEPDYLVVVSFGQILEQEILDIPRIAPVNLHASILPRWRGASPIHHAILSGDTETGVTVQKIVQKLDAGPIFAQEKIVIEPRETFTALHNKLAPIGARLLLKTLKRLPPTTEQDESKATICHKLKRKHGILNNLRAEEADRHVRALNPWPGAKIVSVDGEELKVLESSLEPTPDSFPVSMLDETELHLVKVQPAGKKPMSGKAWATGMANKNGCLRLRFHA